MENPEEQLKTLVKKRNRSSKKLKSLSYQLSKQEEKTNSIIVAKTSPKRSRSPREKYHTERPPKQRTPRSEQLRSRNVVRSMISFLQTAQEELKKDSSLEMQSRTHQKVAQQCRLEAQTLKSQQVQELQESIKAETQKKNQLEEQIQETELKVKVNPKQICRHQKTQEAFKDSILTE